jgi:hypothetical protein
MNYPSKREYENPEDFDRDCGLIEEAADQERDRKRDEWCERMAAEAESEEEKLSAVVIPAMTDRDFENRAGENWRN